jgi:ribose transport system ATP-binding protein
MPLERLSPGEQQLVEIAKAFALEARLIIFDEPTTSLTHREIQRLFLLIGQIRARGRSVIYISHNLEHVLQLSEQLVVLRDGAVAGAGPRVDFSGERLISLMVGRAVSQVFPARSAPVSTRPVLEVRGLSEPGVVRDISFTLHEGEIVGLAGLMGAGRSELARILFGLDRFARGKIKVDGAPAQTQPKANIALGMAFLTENRREEGLCLNASVVSNVSLVTLPRSGRGPFRWLAPGALRREVSEVSRAVRLKAAGPDSLVQFLSGGNQQKVVLAKWLLAQPRVILLDEPTRGIDVAARAEVYQLIDEMAGRGCAVLLISSEMEELIGLCHRILVMRRGEITAEFRRAEFDRGRILAAALQDPGKP